MRAEAAPPPPASAPMPRPATQARRDSLSPPRKVSALAAISVDTGATRYELPTRVSIPDQSATMVLLLSHEVKGESVFLFALTAVFGFVIASIPRRAFHE